MKTFTYHRKKVSLKAERYASNNSLAVEMLDKDGELMDVITVNIPDGMASDSMAYIDTNNHPDIPAWLERNRLGISMMYQAKSGFCTYPLYTIFTEEF